MSKSYNKASASFYKGDNYILLNLKVLHLVEYYKLLPIQNVVTSQNNSIIIELFSIDLFKIQVLFIIKVLL